MIMIKNLNWLYTYQTGVGIHLPNSIIKSPMPDQMAKNNYSKPDMSLMNHNENFRENNVLLPDENKVMIIL